MKMIKEHIWKKILTEDFSFYTRQHRLRPSIMSPETSVLLLWLVLLQEGASIRPVVTFDPNYKKIFKKESIIMTCNMEATRGEDLNYIWYKDDVQVHNGKSYSIQNAGTSHSGNYRCQTSTGENGDTARLDVSSDWLILQTPLYVYEGDEMTLRCHHYPGYNGRQTTFYKENKVISHGSGDEEFHISNVDRTAAGKYKCTKEVYYHSSSQYEAEASVSVEELFTTPTIKVIPHPVFKKNNMTLNCETSLHPSRQNTRLRFTFYREGRVVQRSGDKDIYEVSMVQPEHSGNYSCEVETTDRRVRKKSADLLIQIEELFSHPNIKVTKEFFEGDPLTLTCDTTLSPHIKPTEVQFAFYRDGQMVGGLDSSNKYEVRSAHLEHSGNYICEVKSLIYPTKKISNWSKISVKELFSPPVLKVSPDLLNEGDNMILICDTNLTNPQTQTTKLQYAFYRDGENIQGFNSSNIYEAKFIKKENSGTYTCEIQTPNGSVKKRSKEVQIEESKHFMIILSASLGLFLLIVIISIFVYVYHKRRSSNNNPQPPTGNDNKYTADYHVTSTKLDKANSPQSSVSKDNGSDVVYVLETSKAKRQVKFSKEMPDTSEDIYQNINYDT